MQIQISNQRGVALFVALVFLVLITLISVTAMRSSTMELRMASNEQEHRSGVDSAQSAVLAVINSNRIRVGIDGTVTCFGFGENPESGIDGIPCNIVEQLPTGAGTGGENLVQVILEGSGTCPPSIASSARGASSLRTDGSSTGGSCAYFSVDSLYDATDRRGGRVETQEGFIRLMF